MRRPLVFLLGLSCLDRDGGSVGAAAAATRHNGVRRALRELSRRHHDRWQRAVDSGKHAVPHRCGIDGDQSARNMRRCRCPRRSCVRFSRTCACSPGTNPSMATGGYTGRAAEAAAGARGRVHAAARQPPQPHRLAPAMPAAPGGRRPHRDDANDDQDGGRQDSHGPVACAVRSRRHPARERQVRAAFSRRRCLPRESPSRPKPTG